MLIIERNVGQIRRSRAEVAVGLFWAKSWLFWPHLKKIYRLHFIKIDRQTKLEVNRNQNNYFSPQKPQK